MKFDDISVLDATLDAAVDGFLGILETVEALSQRYVADKVLDRDLCKTFFAQLLQVVNGLNVPCQNPVPENFELSNLDLCCLPNPGFLLDCVEKDLVRIKNEENPSMVKKIEESIKTLRIYLNDQHIKRLELAKKSIDDQIELLQKK